MNSIFLHVRNGKSVVVKFFDELSEDEASVDELVEDLKQIFAKHRQATETNSKAVIVKGVDTEVFHKYLEGVADQAPRNKQFAQAVEDYQIFPSAIAASKHLGYDHNEVAMALNRVRSKPTAERIAVVRGVSVMYFADDIASSKD